MGNAGCVWLTPEPLVVRRTGTVLTTTLYAEVALDAELLRCLPESMHPLLDVIARVARAAHDGAHALHARPAVEADVAHPRAIAEVADGAAEERMALDRLHSDDHALAGAVAGALSEALAEREPERDGVVGGERREAVGALVRERLRGKLDLGLERRVETPETVEHRGWRGV